MNNKGACGYLPSLSRPIEDSREEVRVLDAVALALLQPELERRLVFESEVKMSPGHPEREAHELVGRRDVCFVDPNIHCAR